MTDETYGGVPFDIAGAVFDEQAAADRHYGKAGEPELICYDESELDRYEKHLAERYGIESPTWAGYDGQDYARARQAIAQALVVEADRAQAHVGPEGFTCPTCGHTSYHPTDVAQGYCATCCDWTGR